MLLKNGSGAVLGIGCRPQSHFRTVHLGQMGQILDDPRGTLQANRQNAFRKGVQRAGMPCLLDLEQVLNLPHHGKGGRPLGFMKIEDLVLYGVH